MPFEVDPPEAASDASVDELRAQREEALVRTFGECRNYLFAYCLKIGVKNGDVDDLLQDVWIIAHENLHQLRDVQAIAGWVRRILWTRARNRWARCRECTIPDNDDDRGENELWGTTDAAEDPVEIALVEERATFVQSALARVCELDRRSLFAFYFERRSLKEMAAEEEVPVGTIKRRLHVARKRLGAVFTELVG